ncbi:hypothetical protein ACQKP0_19320 [Heyndrickxia sp. NPDC080065]|uniref:hypothetical protein n=1 Tax=Heyndrickxia sp. NPDC080065 TaxID=3390568 RepID=UPI003D08B869
MPMKNQWLLNVGMVLLSWLSLPFLGRRNIKRFLPASILIVLIEGINVQVGKKRKWWVFYNKPNSYFSGEFPFNIGPHLVGSMWILKWTFGNFKRFILLNAIVDAFFTFPLIRFLKKLKVATLVRINNWQFFLYIFYKAFLLYWFQYLFENKKNMK